MNGPAPSTLDSIGFGAVLPSVLLEDVTKRAFETHASVAMFAGFGVLGLGFLWQMAQEVLRDIRGDKPDYLKPLFTLVGFTALIAMYQPFVKGCVHVVTHLGSDLLVGEPLDASFRHRMMAFAANWKQHSSENMLGMFNAYGILLAILQTLVILAYALVSWSAGLLRLGQTFMLAVIITYGPLSLGCASLGGIFGALGMAWFWALIEVSAWSLTLDVLNYVFAPLGRDVPSTFYWISELMLCLSLFTLIASVPLITSMLVRGQAAAMMPRSNVLSLGSALSAVQSARRYGEMAVSASQGAKRVAQKSAQMAVRASSERLKAPGIGGRTPPGEGAGSRPSQGGGRGKAAEPSTSGGQSSGPAKGQTPTQRAAGASSSGGVRAGGQREAAPAGNGASGTMPNRPPPKSPWFQKFAERMHKATRTPKK